MAHLFFSFSKPPENPSIRRARSESDPTPPLDIAKALIISEEELQEAIRNLRPSPTKRVSSLSRENSGTFPHFNPLINPEMIRDKISDLNKVPKTRIKRRRRRKKRKFSKPPSPALPPNPEENCLKQEKQRKNDLGHCPLCHQLLSPAAAAAAPIPSRSALLFSEIQRRGSC
jgi:hypothetical protein